jgi:antirestriction protein ArdC
MTKANPAYHKRDLYSDVTSRILAELETGAAPWIKPWSATPGLNHPSDPQRHARLALYSIEAFKANEVAVAIIKAVITFDGALPIRKMRKGFKTEFGGELIGPSD